MQSSANDIIITLAVPETNATSTRRALAGSCVCGRSLSMRRAARVKTATCRALGRTSGARVKVTMYRRSRRDRRAPSNLPFVVFDATDTVLRRPKPLLTVTTDAAATFGRKRFKNPIQPSTQQVLGRIALASADSKVPALPLTNTLVPNSPPLAEYKSIAGSAALVSHNWVESRREQFSFRYLETIKAATGRPARAARPR
ncbi:hypothetical protein EVAR_886_1 [Eumeta japonica]|uniref:Uncharacterized protein n=1 Tax=Eumeta variegata TaxID=151549 RepID=A0A4C1SEI9_EUMVA|nr:hypothetical protein EVAR_886_1 [Eumeta japonica]